MKGISTIIASIILVVITIGLISTAYLYFTGIVTVGPVLTIASAYCNSTLHITITLRNDGTSALNTTDITWLRDGNTIAGVSCDPEILDAGGTSSCILSGESGVNNVVAIGPKNQASGPVTCP